MSERPHFSKRFLIASEHAQRTIGQTSIGRSLTKAVAGSSYPLYRQLDWHTPDYPYNPPDLRATIKVPGDRNAGRVPRFWRMATVIAFPTEELEELRIENFKSPQKRAVSYVAENTVHVGTQPNEGYLFERYTKNELAIAMRLGKGPLEATVGLWLPDERTFESVGQLRVVEAAIPVSALVEQYPGIKLV
jgi:hypothetical protein